MATLTVLTLAEKVFKKDPYYIGGDERSTRCLSASHAGV